MISTFIKSITDTIEEKPSVLIIYIIIGFLALIGVFRLFDSRSISASKYATITACGESFKLEKYINEDGDISELLEEEIFNACSKDGDMKEVITEQIINDLREDIREEVREELKNE